MDSEDIGRYSTHASPGDGVTEPGLSREPLATEGEATPGPDDENPFRDLEDRQSRRDPPGRDGKAPDMLSFSFDDSGSRGESRGGFGLPDFLDF